MSFSERLKEARKKVGLSQKQLADKLGTSPQNLNQYESGKRNPKKKTVEKLAEALKLEYAYSDTGEPYFYIADDSEIVDSSFNDWQKSTAHTDGTLSKITDPNERKRAEELIDILHVSPETMTYRQQNAIILNLAASLTLDARNKVIEFLEILNKVPEYVKEDSEEIYD